MGSFERKFPESIVRPSINSSTNHRQADRSLDRSGHLAIEQALQDSDTAEAVAGLTAVQTQGFRASETEGRPSGSTSRDMIEDIRPDGQANQYGWARPQERAMGHANSGAPWTSAYTSHSPITSIGDTPNFSKAFQGLPDFHQPGMIPYDPEGDFRNKKRRITNSSPQGPPADYPSGFPRQLPSGTNPPYHEDGHRLQQIPASHSLHSLPTTRNKSYEVDDTDQSDPSDPKRRKIQRACDLCRRKKIRCDGAHSSRRNQKCSNCVEGKAECTYVEAAKRRGPPLGYIETLEWKVAKLEALAQRLKPSIELTNEVGPSVSRETFDIETFKLSLEALDIPYNSASNRKGSRNTKDGKNRKGAKAANDMDSSSARASETLKEEPHGIPETWEDIKRVCEQTMQVSTMGNADALKLGQPHSAEMSNSPLHQSRIRNLADTSRAGSLGVDGIKTKQEEEDHEDQDFAQCLVAKNDSEGYRYLGKSSGVQFLRSAMDFKAAMAGEPVCIGPDTRRLQFWALPIWEATVSQHNIQQVDLSRWPEPQLAQALIDAYFDNDNLTLPLLNRLIFQKDYDNQRWTRDDSFAKVCFTLFAVAARHIDHPQVYWHAQDEAAARAAMADIDMYRHSAGWRWMEVVVKMGKSFLKPATLEELQVFNLCALFLQRSAVISTVWAVVGMGLKSAIDIGMHTRVGLQRCSSVAEAELYKRAFWNLVFLDRLCCAGMGRTLSIRDEDFDVDYPLDVDDEYWDTGNVQTDFKQPPGKPSKIAMYISMLSLERIVASAIMNVYTVNKAARGKEPDNPEYQKKLIADLDSDLYAWLDSVPAHLKWDSERDDPELFQQSAVLYCNYYFAQILVHRPFIPTSRTAPSVAALALPSLAICTNAARACARIANACCQRNLIQHHICMPAFSAAIVLLMGVWGGNRLGTGTSDRASTLEDVRSCLRSLKMTENWWRGAGRMRDILMELANVSDASIDTPTPNPDGGPYKKFTRSQPNSTNASPKDALHEHDHFSNAQSRYAENVATRDQQGLGRSLGPPGSQLVTGQQFNHSGPGPQCGNSLPWWFVPKDSGMQGFEAVVSHPMVSSGSARDPISLNGFGYGNAMPNEMTGSISASINNFGEQPMNMLGQSFPTNAFPAQSAQATNAAQSAQPVDFWALQDPNAMEMNGVLADIWSMAPSTFEMDQWSMYLSQPQTGDGALGVPQSQGVPQPPYF